jgi:DNA gyrase subunit A
MIRKPQQLPLTNYHKQSASVFLEKALFSYGNEINQNRAFPRLEDGLKPIQRLIIWATRDCGAEAKFVKSAQIAGHTIAHYSPHGDAAAYQSMVNMVNTRYPLVTGRGNFGSISTSAAAARYTEAHLSAFIRKVATDLPDLAVVPYEPNYNEQKTQPVYLPTTIPLILLNGYQSIGYALKGEMPGFNLAEVISAVLKLIETKDEKKALARLAGPDHAQCRLLSDKKSVQALLASGEGALEYECLYSVEKAKKGYRMSITGYVPEFNLSGFLEKCGKMQDEGVIDYVRNATSADNGDLILVEYSSPEILQSKLLPLLRKKINYAFNLIFERNGKLVPELAGIGKILTEWLEVRRQTVAATLQASLRDLAAALSREEAKLKAVLNLKEVFKALEQDGDFRENLKNNLKFNDQEAAIIAEMRVEALKKASGSDIKDRINKLQETQKSIQYRLDNVDGEISNQLKELANWAKKETPDLYNRMMSLPD